MAEVKGKIILDISDDYLSGYLLFTPNPEGKLWTLKNINDFLDQEGVVVGLDDEMISKAYSLFSEKGGFKSDIIARGTAPDPPSPESFTLKESEIPETIIPIMEKTLTNAPPPVIEEIQEKTVKGLRKKEIIEQRIPVKVNPAVIEQGYYRKGEVTGTFKESSGGNPGESILGHKINPGNLPRNKSRFYLGSGLTKDARGNVIAQSNGFLRKGKNWADLIPFNDHTLELSLSKDKSDCIMTITPGLKYLPPPEVELVYRLAEKMNYDKSNLINAGHLKSYIHKIISTGKKHSLSISTNRDSEVEILLNETKTEATLHLVKGSGKGEPFNLHKVSTVINESGLKGLNFNEIKKQISAFYHSSDISIEISLCKGVLPDRGKDRSINFAVPFQTDQFINELKQHIDENPALIAAYSSTKDFPIEKVTQAAIVKSGEKLFTLGTLSAGKEGRDVYGKTIRGVRGNDPTLHLYEGINYQEGMAVSEEDGIFEILFDREELSLYGRVRKHLDSKIDVKLSENRMQAMLNIDLPSGSGLYASVERIKEALETAEVTEGILEDRIEEAAEISNKGEVVMDFLVAEGKYPVDTDSELRLALDIDQQSRNSIAVAASEKIGEVLQKNKNSSSGYNVLGEPLESEGLDSFEIGKNIEVKEEDENGVKVLYASASGQLFFDSKKIFIKDTLSIEGNVNSNMGKILFPGNIVVKGAVQSQVVLRAGNNITIEDVVESALVTAEGNIYISRGVKGNKKAALHSQKSIRILYAEETNLMALNRIDVEKALLHCNIKCNGFLQTGDKGRIIGGIIKVKEGLTAASIGSEKGASTAISFGQDYLVEDQINQTEKDIKKVQDQILKVDSIINKIMEQGGKNEVLLEAREKKRKALKIMEKKNLKMFLLREKFEMHYNSSIKILNTLYPGTIIESHGRTLEISEPLRSIEVFFDQNTGKVSYKALK